jgi:NAD(P)-dependent dehydrogenase (short-subunit alcohol dehydrogenase family)
MDELRYDGRVAIVTGAGRGIGRGHALLLAAKGAQVVVADYGGAVDGKGGESSSPADDVVAEIRAKGGAAVACCASVAEETGAANIVNTALEEFGRLDVVVNNAGISDPGLFEDLTVEQFRRMIDVHYLGTLFVIRAAWPHLVDAGYGRIVNTSSESILGGLDDLTSYAAAKGAVFALTKCLATEGVRYGIHTNAITPRAFTRMSAAHSMAGRPPEVIEEAKRTLAPELNAPVVAFLAHESCPLNGEVLQGGMGTVSRIAVVRTNGLTKDGITAEDIAENLDRILDVKDGTVTDVRPLIQMEHK